MNCPKCNTNIKENTSFCNNCGYKLIGNKRVLLTNALAKIKRTSGRLFNRVTYSTLTEALFFSTLLATIGGILAMFTLVSGGVVFAIPAALIVASIIYRTIVLFVDIDTIPDERFARELRYLLTFFSYSLFLIVFAGVVIGVSMLIGSLETASIIAIFTGLISVYGGIAGLSISIIIVIFLSASIRKNSLYL